jgi:hypothetical protein
LKEFWELLEKLRTVEKQGYIRTHRAGPTGIGKTLEDLLGIPENNIPGPNGVMIELKTARKNAKSMITLFTKSPLPKRANAALLKKYGYASRRGNNRKELHTTVTGTEYNRIKGRLGLKIGFETDRIVILGPPPDENEEGYYDREMLSQSFRRKLPRILFVKADSRGNGTGEEFWFNEGWLLSGFSFENFVRLLQSGDIVLDIRIGQYPNGRPHDHGTGFRVKQSNLDLCFLQRERVL